MPTKPVDKEEDTASPALPAYQLPGREMDVRIRGCTQGLDGFGQRDRYMYVCVGAYLLSGASVGRREMDVRIRNAPQGLDGLGQSQRVRSPSQINK